MYYGMQSSHVSIPNSFNNWESNMALLLLLSNCVKEQCYQEQSSNTEWHTIEGDGK